MDSSLEAIENVNAYVETINENEISESNNDIL
jgi:hypothetical protein